MKRFATLAIALQLALSLAAPAFSQSLPNLALANLNYTVRKRTVNPQGELKEKIDQNDREMAEARRLGRMGDVRRLLAKGQALLAGTAWTDELDFASSITLRTERVFVDTQKPYAVRIEQIYSSTLAVDHNLTAHVSLLKPRAGGRGGNGGGGGGGGRGAAAPPEVVKDFGSIEDVSRDLRESPYLMELDLASVADGTYQVRVEVMDGDENAGVDDAADHRGEGHRRFARAHRERSRIRTGIDSRGRVVSSRFRAQRESRASGRGCVRRDEGDRHSE